MNEVYEGLLLCVSTKNGHKYEKVLTITRFKVKGSLHVGFLCI